MNELYGDWATTATGTLVGGLNGRIATQIGDYVYHNVVLRVIRPTGGFMTAASLTANLLARAVISSTVYYYSVQWMPETTANPAYPFTFFLADTGLTGAALAIVSVGLFEAERLAKGVESKM